MNIFRTAGTILAIASLVSILISLPSSPVSTARAEEGEVVLKFGLEEGQILNYKGTSTIETNFKGFLVNSVHNDQLEMTLVENLGDSLQRIAITYVDCSDRRSMGGAAMADFDSPIKPKGKTVKILVGPDGDVVEVQGFIMGLRAGPQLDRYVDKWFFKLPDEPVSKGSKWTVELPLEKDLKEQEESGTEIKGPIHFELKKFGKENGIEIAEIEMKGKLTVHSDNDQGVMDGEIELEGKFKVALDGGYIVKGESSTEMKGEMVTMDVAGNESSNELSRLSWEEVKLEK